MNKIINLKAATHKSLDFKKIIKLLLKLPVLNLARHLNCN